LVFVEAAILVSISVFGNFP